MQIMRIDEIVESVSITHSFNKNELIFLNTSDVLEGNIVNHNVMNISDLKGQAKKTIQNQDILFSEIRPKNKRYAYVSVENPDDYVVSTKLMVLRNITPLVRQKYFYYFITSDYMLNYLQRQAESRICSFPQITFDLMAGFKIKIPSIESQDSIIRRLDSITNHISLNGELISSLEEYTQLLFHKWFINFNFPDENGNPYKYSGGKMEEVEGRLIPKGWSISNVGKLSLNYDNKRIPLADSERRNKQGVYPYYGATQIMDYVEDYIFDGIFCLIAEDGSVINEENRPYMQYATGQFWVNNHAHVLQGNGISTEFLYLALKQTNVSGAITGAIQKKINQKNLNNISVIKPRPELSERFDAIIKPIFDKIVSIKIENQLLEEARDLLIKKLII